MLIADIDDIHVVVNFDFPTDVTSYVHRVGRSGRNGKKGLAFTFLNYSLLENRYVMRELRSIVERSGNVMPDNISTYA